MHNQTWIHWRRKE